MREQRRPTPSLGIIRWLHPLLVISTLLYLYSPFLDHWFDFDAQTRPHTHIVINAPLSFSPDSRGGAEHELHAGADHNHAHDEDAEVADDFYLCYLDLDANFSLLFGAFMLPNTSFTTAEIFTTARMSPYQAVSVIFPAIATPPPNLL